MPKKIENALTPATVRSAKKPGLLADGGGLYLQITQSRVDEHRINSHGFLDTALGPSCG
jgi:hypothetical protein